MQCLQLLKDNRNQFANSKSRQGSQRIPFPVLSSIGRSLPFLKTWNLRPFTQRILGICAGLACQSITLVSSSDLKLKTIKNTDASVNAARMTLVGFALIVGVFIGI